MIALFPYLNLISLIILMKGLIADSWREAFLFGLVLWGVIVFGLTEVLSFFHLLDFFPLLISWIALTLFTVVFLVLKRDTLKSFNLPVWQKGNGFLTACVCFVLFIIFILTGVSAFVCPPNTFDSLTYHIARVAHWAQNRSVDFYPTHILRQLVSPVWLEYAALHFQILSRGDYFANSIQWLAMIASVGGVSLIAQYLGLSILGQVVTAVLAATVPMGIIQASSMQGDYATTLWLICAACILLKSTLTWTTTVLLAMSIGLAFLTKGTGAVFGLPLIIGFLIKTRFHLLKFLVFVLIFLMMTGGYLARNYQAPPHSIFLASDVHQVRVRIKDISWSTVMANVIRNAGMQLATSSKKVNHSIDSGLYGLGKALGVDINDPRATFLNQVFHVTGPSRDESYAQNGVHFLIYTICFIIAIFFRPQRNFGEYSLYLLGMFAGLVLFVRWQPWSSRFQLPLFVMAAPVVGYVCDRLKLRTISIIIIVSGHSLFINSLAPAFYR